MLDYKNLLALAKAAIKADKSAPVAYSYDGKDYTYEQVQATLAKELNELGGSHASYRNNKNLIFALIEEVVNEVLPKKVEGIYTQLAETKQFGQGEAPKFNIKSSASRNRAKTFITRVGLEGRYEVFKLGGAQTIEIQSTAFGGAAQIGLEEFLDGRVDFNELIAIVMEGLEDRIQEEVAKGLATGIEQLPESNVHSQVGFEAAEFDRLLKIADSYSANGKATIYCDSLFAAHLAPSADNGLVPESVKTELWNKGYLSMYKGHNVVILPNSISTEGDLNSHLALDPSKCYILPNTGMKPIFIGFEGDTCVDEHKNRDWSREVQVYKKVGVGVMFTNDICVYEDTQLVTEL
jgi:hypothetical protein